MILKNKLLQALVGKKKIACSTNVIEGLWEKREKNILPTRLLEKKFLMTRNHPPHPSRVKLSALKVAVAERFDCTSVTITTTKNT